MKQRFSRLLLSLSAALTLAVGVASVAAATEPPTVGGELSAGGNKITVVSKGNVPAHVLMSAESVTLSESQFDIQPGESHALTFTGKAVGYVSALMTIKDVSGQEAGSATLSVGLAPVKPRQPSPLPTILFGALLILGALLVIRRLRIWTWRIHVTRKS